MEKSVFPVEITAFHRETAGFYARRKLCSPLSLASAVRRTRTNRKHHLGLVLLPAPNTLTTAPRAHERPT
jgi:hypothetical protein